MSLKRRAGLAVVGLLVLLVGWAARDIEAEYGSGLNFSIFNAAGGDFVVSEVDEQRGTSTVVFSGSQEEAAAYTDKRRSDGVNQLLPSLVIGTGVLILAFAIVGPLLLRLRRPDGSSTG